MEADIPEPALSVADKPLENAGNFEHKKAALMSFFAELRAEEEPKWPDEKDIVTSVAAAQTLIQYVESMMQKVAVALADNRHAQKVAMEKQNTLRLAGSHQQKKIPVQRYLPPYFKDEDQMCAPYSDEASRRIAMMVFDPLMREEKKWTPREVKRLRETVRKELIEIKTSGQVDSLNKLQEKLRGFGQDASKRDIDNCKEEIELMKRKLEFEERIADEDLINAVNQDLIDWEKINNLNFDGLRRADALRLKWINEVSPIWNHKPWSVEEVEGLKLLTERKKYSWPVIANKLKTRRTAWQCFQKYHMDVRQNKSEWTQEEDQRLLHLCRILQTENKKIQWEKVTYYMKGRSRQQVRVRYTCILDKYIKHGPWVDQEDLRLIAAVNRLGARDWSKIAKIVTCRTAVQCKERWVSVMNRREAREWSLEEDEKLVCLVHRFGLGKWTECAMYLPGRTADQCRLHYQSVVLARSRFYAARNANAQPPLEENPNSLMKIYETVSKSQAWTDWKKKAADVAMDMTE